MSAAQTESGATWIKSQCIPGEFDEIVTISCSNDQFFLATKNINNRTKAIHKYNTRTNKFNEVWTAGSWVQITRTTFDRHYNTLYLWYCITATNPFMNIINLSTKTTITKKNAFGFQACYLGFLNVNSVLHMIGGELATKHITWNSIDNKTEELYDFENLIGIKDMFGTKAIYVPSKHMILLIGAISRSNDPINDHDEYIGIWRYYLKLKKWEKVDNIKFEFYNVTLALNADEDYVIVAGGYHDYKESDKIQVLDIRNENEYKLMESAVVCPDGGIHNIVITGGGIKNEILVIGWIKKLYESLDSKDLVLPPMDIIKLIVDAYTLEEIQWIKREGNEHYVIALNDILSSCISS